MGFIKPHDMQCNEIDLAFKTEYCDEDEEAEIRRHGHYHYKKSTYDWMIICDNSKVAIFWEAVEIVTCMLSSYIYTWLAVFGYHFKDDVWIAYFWWFIEFTLSICMIVKFNKDFVPDGQTAPVRNHAKIRQYYYENGFM